MRLVAERWAGSGPTGHAQPRALTLQSCAKAADVAYTVGSSREFFKKT